MKLVSSHLVYFLKNFQRTFRRGAEETRWEERGGEDEERRGRGEEKRGEERRRGE